MLESQHGMKDQDTAVVATRQAALLERQFRILREDMIGPMRDALRLLLASSGPNPATKSPRTRRQRTLISFGDVAFEGVGCNHRSAMLVSFRLPPKHPGHEKKKKKREEYWDIRGKRTLARDSFVGFILGEYVLLLSAICICLLPGVSPVCNYVLSTSVFDIIVSSF